MSGIITCPGHPGLVNDPGHFINLIDSRCVPYTTVQLFLFAGGCFLWVVAYGILIRNALRNKYMEMAAIAVCSNFAWEFTWSFLFKTDMGWFLVWMYRAWFFMDVYIFWLLLKYGPKQMVQPAFRRHFTPAVLAITAAFGILYWLFVRQGMDEPIGANSAYICQVILSSTCLMLLMSSPSARVFSTAVAWLKCVGTGMNTVMMFLHYPENRFLHALGVVAFCIDITFIAYLAGRRRREESEPDFREFPEGRIKEAG
jgi:hypothetical protein